MVLCKELHVCTCTILLHTKYTVHVCTTVHVHYSSLKLPPHNTICNTIQSIIIDTNLTDIEKSPGELSLLRTKKAPSYD